MIVIYLKFINTYTPTIILCVVLRSFSFHVFLIQYYTLLPINHIFFLNWLMHLVEDKFRINNYPMSVLFPYLVSPIVHLPMILLARVIPERPHFHLISTSNAKISIQLQNTKQNKNQTMQSYLPLILLVSWGREL